MVQFRKRKSDGQSFPVGTAKKIRASNPSNDVGGIKIGNGTKIPNIEADNIDLRELRDHPSFEESNDWLDVFANTPEVVVYDERRDIFYIWFGGESHTVHEYSTGGNEFDVFTFGFEKNKLDKDEVLDMISRRLSEPIEEDQ